MKGFDKYVHIVDDFLSANQCQDLVYRYNQFTDESDGAGNFGVKIKTVPLSYSKELNQKSRDLLKEYCYGKAIEHLSLSLYGYDLNWYRPGVAADCHGDDDFVITEEGKLRSHPITILCTLTDHGNSIVFPDHDRVVDAKEGRAIIFPASFAYPHLTLPDHKDRFSLRIKFVRNINDKTHSSL